MPEESSWAAERSQLLAQLEAFKVIVDSLKKEKNELQDENKALASSLAEVLQEVRSEKRMLKTASLGGKRGPSHDDTDKSTGILPSLAASIFDDLIPESNIPTVASLISSAIFGTSSRLKSTLSSTKQGRRNGSGQDFLRQRSNASASAINSKKIKLTEQSHAEESVVLSGEDEEDLVGRESSHEPPKSRILRSTPRKQPGKNKRKGDASDPDSQLQLKSTKEMSSSHEKYKLRSAVAQGDVELDGEKSNPRKQYKLRSVVPPGDVRLEDEESGTSAQTAGRKRTIRRKENVRQLLKVSGSENLETPEASRRFPKHQLRDAVVSLSDHTATNFTANRAPKPATDTDIIGEEDAAKSDDERSEPATDSGETTKEEAEESDEESDEDDLPQEADTGAREEGPATERHKCSKCSATFLDARECRKHYRTHNCYVCSTCGQEFDTFELKSAHEKEHRAKFVCDTCKATFVFKSRLEDHVKRTHPDAPQFVCERCDKSFPTRYSLNDHLKTHPMTVKFDEETRTYEYRYPCSFCGMVFSLQANKARHELTHTTDRPFSCGVCRSTFRSRELLEVHREAIHADDPACYCQVCDKYFKNKYILDGHRRLHVLKRAGEERTGKPGEENFSCKKCPATFATIKDARKHSLTHRPGFCCSYCGKRFLTKCLLVDHERTHTGDLPCTCEICGKRFRSEHLLKRHRRAIHPTNPSNVCDVCGKCFKLKPSLKAHMKIHTQTDDRFACSVCDKSFRMKGALKAHLRSHTGERPVKCPHCDATFGQHSTRDRHVAYVHKNDRRFPCKHCKSRFVFISDLAKHERTHTGERPYECEFCGDRFVESGSRKKHQMKKHKNQRALDS